MNSAASAPVIARKKLIEVALPLDAINAACVREKSIRHGHPSTLHLWWARRPLAAARAVIFAQMVDDPSTYVDTLLGIPETRRAAERELKKRRELWEKRKDEFEAATGKEEVVVPEPGREPTLDDCTAEIERQRLFQIIEDLVLWENTTNEAVLDKARAEIWQSWRRACADNAGHPRAKELFDRNKLPAFHDPFAGGGSLPLEAQRLGLEAYASDLNPVAVLITKAMIEIPPKFAGRPPVNAGSTGGDVAGSTAMEGRQGPRRGRALLWQVDTGRSREAHWPSLREGRDHLRNGEGAAGLEAAGWAEAHRHRLAVGADGQEPEPGLPQRGGAAGWFIQPQCKERQGSVDRSNRSPRWRRLRFRRPGRGRAETRRHR